MTTAETDIRISFGPHPMCQHCFEFVTHCAPVFRLAQEFRDYEMCCRCGDQTMSGCPGHGKG